MFKLTEKNKTSIKDLLDDPTFENCGIIDKFGQAIALTNVAVDPTVAFTFDKEEWEIIKDDAIAIWHTHCLDTQAGTLSPKDVENSKLQNLPYILYHSIFENWDLFDPNNPHPYPLTAPETFDANNPESWLGLPWEYGRSDCFTLFKGWYKGLGIELQEYPRGKDSDERFSQAWNLFLESYKAEGFIGIPPAEAWAPSPGERMNLQKNDVLLMTMPGSTNPVHCALIADDPSSMQILHHLGPESQLLCRHRLTKSYRDRTVLILRHQSFLETEN